MRTYKNMLDGGDNTVTDISVQLDTDGKLIKFQSGFGDETLDDVQKLVDKLIERKYITLGVTPTNSVSISINVIDLSDDLYLETYHVHGCFDVDDYDTMGPYDCVVLFNKEFLDYLIS